MPDIDAKNALFALLALIILASSAAVVLARNPVRATFFLIVSFIPTAGVYILLHAPLVGILQVLVYTGAILVLFTFVVMMINPKPGPAEEFAAAIGERRRNWLASVGVTALAALALYLATAAGTDGIGASAPPVAADFGSARSLGLYMFREAGANPRTISLQLLGALILAGIIVAVNLSRGRRRK